MYAVVRDGNYEYAKVITEQEFKALQKKLGDYAPRLVKKVSTLADAEKICKMENEKARKLYGGK